MAKIDILLQILEYVRSKGLQTIKIIEDENAWDYKLSNKEFSVKETYYHTVKSIFEDTGNWFLSDSTSFKASDNPIKDLNKSLDRMIESIKDFSDEKLGNGFTFQWGDTTTVSGAIIQNLFHAAEHFSQLRHRIGIYKRSKSDF